MNDWYIFKGDNKPSDDKIGKLPSAPKWRQFKARFDEVEQPEGKKGEGKLSWDELRGMAFEAGEEEKRMVNAALYLRRPCSLPGIRGPGNPPWHMRSPTN